MRIALALLLAFAMPSVAAPSDTATLAGCRPEVRDAWIRMTPPMPMGAGYFTVENRCARAFVIVSASSSRFGGVSMHETRVEQGVSRMRARASVVLRPGEKVEFRPRGLHLMLMQPKAPLQTGSRLRIDLRLAQGGAIPADFVVRGFSP